MTAPAPSLAVIVATRDRAASLRRLLATAMAMRGTREAAIELLVADNGSRDETRGLVAAAAAEHPWIRYLDVPGGGKARALNRAIRASAAPLLAFLDDDVELDPSWLVAVDAYFARARVAAAQGTIRLPPAAAGDARLVDAVERWRTIPRCDLGPAATDSGSLIGANMMVARSTFARVGLFDERLGPGAAGTSEDTELARRIRAAGGRIGYVADAIVYHAVDPTRLCARYFRTLHEARGRSRSYYKPSGAARILPNLGIAALHLASSALTGRADRRTRALGRWYHYRAMLAARHAPRLTGGAPRLEGERPDEP